MKRILAALCVCVLLVTQKVSALGVENSDYVLLYEEEVEYSDNIVFDYDLNLSTYSDEAVSPLATIREVNVDVTNNSHVYGHSLLSGGEVVLRTTGKYDILNESTVQNINLRTELVTVPAEPQYVTHRVWYSPSRLSVLVQVSMTFTGGYDEPFSSPIIHEVSYMADGSSVN